MQQHLRVEMNLTPLIDVLLVLLVIFMAALPLTQKGVDATLPTEMQRQGPVPPPSSIVVEYDADGRLAINQQDVSIGELQLRLSEIYAQRRDKTMFIAGAGTLRYQSIVDVIDAAKGAGVDRVGIITEAMRQR